MAGAFETVVRAEPERASPLATRLDPSEAATRPGTFGDALRAIESAPGVARTALGSGLLVIWGAAPQESKVLLDGMELPALYHLGGQRTLLPTGFLKELSLVPGAYGAEYGRALGGLVVIESSEPCPSPGIHGALSADLLDAGAELSGRIGPRLQLRAAGRYSYLDRVLSALAREDLGDTFPLPRYYDFQVQAALELRPRERLTATVLGSGDELRRARALGDPQRVQSETWRRVSYRASLRYERHLPDGAHVSALPWFGWDQNQYEAAFGLTPARLDSRELRYGLRARYRLPLGARLALDVGLDGLGARVQLERAGSLTRPAREGDRAVFGQGPGTEVNADTWTVHTLDLAASLTLAIRLGALRIEPGLRAGGTLVDTSRLLPRLGALPPLGARRIEFVLEPRLRLRYRPHPRLELVAASGLYHQPPDPADLSAVFGNPTLEPSRAVHATAGLSVAAHRALQIELAGFFRSLDRLVVRSPLATPPLARALVQDGAGRSYGAQLALTLAPWHGLSGALAYTLGRSERRDAPDFSWRPSAYDQTHVLQLALRYVLFGIGLGARLRYTSGLPRTDVLSAYYNAREDEYQPVLGPLYAGRLPDFVQLDARIDRTFHLGARLVLTVQLEVQNVTNQKNAEERAYRFDYSQSGYITGLPTLAVLGARIGF
ncbi:MAG: TonB-dependent receptor [Polyangia bacterium]